MASHKITFRSLQGETTLELAEGTTVAEALSAAGLAAGSAVRENGQSVPADDVIESDRTLVASPPAAKHG